MKELNQLTPAEREQWEKRVTRFGFDDDDVYRGIKVLARGGKIVGRTTGGTRPCTLESCGGTCVGVRWGKGKGQLTFPCLRGMDFDSKTLTFKILP